MPVATYLLQKQGDDEFFSTVHRADQNGWSVAAACLKDAYGLETNHAYTLLDAVVLKKDGKPFQKLVKMRNPWATEVYSGPWRDGDPRWTPELRA